MGDPLADPIADLVLERRPAHRDLLRYVEENLAVNNVCRSFLESTREVPVWVDFDAMKQGSELFLRNALLSVAVFVLHSLVLTYIPVNQARVLIHTGRLRGQVLRRLYETATMVKDVLENGALQPGNPGWRSVLRVRLLHALVRRSILQKGQWQHEVQPINQLELAQTATLFGFVVADGLAKLGVPVTDAERESYHHLWRYANFLQGVPTALQPGSFGEEARLHNDLARRYYKPDANSLLLVNSLFSALDMQGPFFLPENVLRGITGFLLDREVAQSAGFAPGPGSHALATGLAGIVRTLGVRYRLAPMLRSWELEAGRRYFHELISHGLAGHPADFRGAA